MFSVFAPLVTADSNSSNGPVKVNLLESCYLRIVIDNFCIALFSGHHKLMNKRRRKGNNHLQENIKYMTTNNVHTEEK